MRLAQVYHFARMKLESMRREHNSFVHKNPDTSMRPWDIVLDDCMDADMSGEYFIQDPVLRMKAMGLNVRKV